MITKLKLKKLIKEIVMEVIKAENTHYRAPTLKVNGTDLARDPLNDPLLNGKALNEGEYRFKNHEWMKLMNGFGVPTDVYYGAIHLGVIESEPDGYRIEMVIGPTREFFVKKSKENKFKTKEDAAKILHMAWKYQRNNFQNHHYEDNSGEEWKTK